MNIEGLRIFTGEPNEVQKKVQGYLSSHPNAKILSTAIGTQPGEPIEEEVPDKPAPQSGSTGSEEGTQGVTTLKAVRYGPPEVIVAVTVGREFQ